MKEYDFIIVGMGLAGVTLTQHLLDQGRSVYAIQEEKSQSASRIAAGLYNPITGRKMTKTWKADKLFPYLIEYYSGLEDKWNSKFLHEIEIYRPFISTEEQNEWSARTADEAYIPYVNKVYYESRSVNARDSYGGISLKLAGYLDTNRFLDHAIEAFLTIDNFQIDHTEFIEGDLKLLDDFVEYNGIRAKQIIYCNGPKTKDSHLFGWLPFSPVKGEILEIESELLSDLIINRGVFVLPIGDNRFRVGSTYDNNDLEWSPSEKGRLMIEEKLKELISVNYKIVGHSAGVRPATRDRKPFIGMHPKYKNVGIFNGLGTKGVSLAPYFANQFTQYLVNQSALDSEVNIERFYSNFKG